MTETLLHNDVANITKYICLYKWHILIQHLIINFLIFYVCHSLKSKSNQQMSQVSAKHSLTMKWEMALKAHTHTQHTPHRNAGRNKPSKTVEAKLTAAKYFPDIELKFGFNNARLSRHGANASMDTTELLNSNTLGLTFGWLFSVFCLQGGHCLFSRFYHTPRCGVANAN